MVTPETLAAAGRVAQRGARMAMQAAQVVDANDPTPNEAPRDGDERADEQSRSATGPQDDPVRDSTTFSLRGRLGDHQRGQRRPVDAGRASGQVVRVKTSV